MQDQQYNGTRCKESIPSPRLGHTADASTLTWQPGNRYQNLNVRGGACQINGNVGSAGILQIHHYTNVNATSGSLQINGNILHGADLALVRRQIFEVVASKRNVHAD